MMKKARHGTRHAQIPMHMTPMIDIVFLLLVFFVFTFRVVAKETEFALMLPRGDTKKIHKIDEPPVPIVVRLVAGNNGVLDHIRVDGVPIRANDQTRNSIFYKGVFAAWWTIRLLETGILKFNFSATTS